MRKTHDVAEGNTSGGPFENVLRVDNCPACGRARFVSAHGTFGHAHCDPEPSPVDEQPQGRLEL